MKTQISSNKEEKDSEVRIFINLLKETFYFGALNKRKGKKK